MLGSYCVRKTCIRRAMTSAEFRLVKKIRTHVVNIWVHFNDYIHILIYFVIFLREKIANLVESIIFMLS